MAPTSPSAKLKVWGRGTAQVLLTPLCTGHHPINALLCVNTLVQEVPAIVTRGPRGPSSDSWLGEWVEVVETIYTANSFPPQTF